MEANAMINVFGIRFPEDEFCFYRKQNGEACRVLNYKILGKEICFLGEDFKNIPFDEPAHLMIAKELGSDQGVPHRFESFNCPVQLKQLVREKFAA